VPEPPRQLRGFERVAPTPGATTLVNFPVDTRALAHWDSAAGEWRVTPGCYGVMVGRSSRDLPLQGTLAVEGAHCAGAIAKIPARG
jgi:beta-glucosidase